MATVYVPILKGKEGEFAALEVLRNEIKDVIQPVIEVPSIPYDYINEGPSKSSQEHIDTIVERLRRAWPDRDMYIDASWFVQEGDDARTLSSLWSACEANDLSAHPVVAMKTSNAGLEAAGAYCERAELGLCLRMVVDDFEEDTDTEEQVARVLQRTNSEPNEVDLLIDMQDLAGEPSRSLLVARSIFSLLPRREQWKRVIFSAASFPEDLSEVSAATVTPLPRLEWNLWRSLQRRSSSLPRRDFLYSDYGIAHPVTKDLDPRTMRMSASIRYTTPDQWLIVKGRNVRQFGFDQYFELCKALVERPEFAGHGYSWGDDYIFDCANEVRGPGNATTWRKVGTNHHITLVTRTLMNQQDGA